MKWKVWPICSYIILIPLDFFYPKQQGWLGDLRRLDMKDKKRGCCCPKSASGEGIPMKAAEMVADGKMVKSCW